MVLTAFDEKLHDLSHIFIHHDISEACEEGIVGMRESDECPQGLNNEERGIDNAREYGRVHVNPRERS